MKPSSLSAASLFGLTLCWATTIGSMAGCSHDDGEKNMTIQVTSSAFNEGQPIPKTHTADGPDLSPPLAWANLPEKTKELALICDDPDAPNGDWVHWVIYKIPADAKGLPEGIPREEKPKEPAGALQGKNSWSDAKATGYSGPEPPPGKVHHYHFKLYALDAPLGAEPGLNKKALLKKIEGHVLAMGKLMGTYKR
jgi:Raf kinase inhibitor-like YbhB/YbcL family protein